MKKILDEKWKNLKKFRINIGSVLYPYPIQTDTKKCISNPIRIRAILKIDIRIRSDPKIFQKFYPYPIRTEILRIGSDRIRINYGSDKLFPTFISGRFLVTCFLFLLKNVFNFDVISICFYFTTSSPRRVVKY